jgi:nucleoside triphosphate diphosphatase
MDKISKQKPPTKLANLPQEPWARLLAVTALLRDPDQGCPWDKEQTFHSLTKYTLEEAYEVVAAVEAGDPAELRDELGDLLFQITINAQLAQEAGDFDFIAVVTSITDKLIRRHPHVFGEAQVENSAAMVELWEQSKQAERIAKTAESQNQGLLAGIPIALPATQRAQKIIGRARRAGFDWDKAQDVIAKIREELDEVESEIADDDHARLTDELGDVLFAVVSLAHTLKVDAETALRHANEKFIRRFSAMEAQLAEPLAAGETITVTQWDEAWQAAKRQEKDQTD